MPTISCNVVTLLGRLAPPGVSRCYAPHTGHLAAFTLVLEPAVGDPTEVPCELTGVAARWCEHLTVGDLVWLTGHLALRDAELGVDTGRLVVVGTALTVVQRGEVRG